MQTLITKLEIQRRVSQLAEEIAQDHPTGDLTMISVLKGAFMFTADLLRRLHDNGITPELDFLRAASYGKGTTPSDLEVICSPSMNLEGKNLLIVDDIIDSGQTLSAIHNALAKQKPNSIEACVLLDKPAQRTVDFSPTYIGFEIPDLFVVGYGLDIDEKFRYLPYISAVNLKT